jgi:hypothetical protein
MVAWAILSVPAISNGFGERSMLACVEGDLRACTTMLSP